MTRPLCTGLAALVVGLCGCSSAAPAPEHGSAVEHGAALFADASVAGTSFNAFSCATCHAADPASAGDTILVGAPLAGAVRRPSYWNGAELDLLRAANACLYYFMLDVTPWTPDDPDAQAIYAYLDSLPSTAADEEPVPFTLARLVEDPGDGDAERGASVYARSCQRCHGGAHTADGRLHTRIPRLPEDSIEEHAPPDYDAAARRLIFVEKVRHGGFFGYGGEMAPFSLEKLSDAELADVLQFLGPY